MAHTTAIARDATLPLYARLMGSAWPRLPEAVRRAHSTGSGLSALGRFRVEYGPHPAARLLARLLRLPRPAREADLALHVEPHDDGETWIRQVGGDRLVSRQFRAGVDLLAERILIVEFRFQLDPSALGLVYHQRAAALAVGPLRVPLPARLAPAIEAKEEAVDRARMRVTVRVTLPLVGLLIAYGGLVDFEEPAS